MTVRPCLGVGTERCANVVAKPGGRCPRCQALAEQARGTTTQRGYGAGWQRIAARRLLEWRRAYGDMCPGWPANGGVSMHPSDDLVVDHDLGPMCRQCNARKAATHDKRRAARGRLLGR